MGLNTHLPSCDEYNRLAFAVAVFVGYLFCHCHQFFSWFLILATLSKTPRFYPQLMQIVYCQVSALLIGQKFHTLLAANILGCTNKEKAVCCLTSCKVCGKIRTQHNTWAELADIVQDLTSIRYVS